MTEPVATNLKRAISPNDSGPPPRRAVAVITLTYAFFASLWIAASDSLLGMLVENPALRAQIGSIKGFVYVAVTSLLLYLLLDHWRQRAQAPEDPGGRTRLAYLMPAFLALALVVPVVAVAVVRLPIMTLALPAAAAILGGEPSTQPGIDYQGVAVLAEVQPGAGTAWHLQAKVDREEVMAPLRTLVWWVSLVALCAIAAVAALILMLWRLQRRADRLSAQAQAADQIREFNQQLENRVAERTAQLAAANRELESFAYAASHDLKAPLRGIAGYSRLLESECRGQLNAEGQGFVANIRQAATQMHQLIDDLLAYSRIERCALQTVPMALPALVQAVLAECRPDLDAAGAIVSVELPELIVPVDYDGMVVALRNLLDNALKFSRHARPPRVDIGGRVDARCAVIWVRDNGIGFDMKFHDRIFEIFHRLESSSAYPGTGVGLALVRKAMQRMGGRVWAEGEAGRGATFFVELPLTLPAT